MCYSLAIMKQGQILTSEQIKKLHQLENIALMLDDGIQNGKILDDNVDKAQERLNKINEEINSDDSSLGSRSYIIYEVQGLIYWINKDEAKAYEFIKSARDIKGDDNLLTQSANDLLSSVEDDATTVKTTKKFYYDWRFYILAVCIPLCIFVIANQLYSNPDQPWVAFMYLLFTILFISKCSGIIHGKKMSGVGFFFTLALAGFFDFVFFAAFFSGLFGS